MSDATPNEKVELLPDFLDLHDYRQRVAAMYRERDEALQLGEAPDLVAQEFRHRRDRLFAEHPQSALDAASRARFTGLEYFPYDRSAVVEAHVDTRVEHRRIEVATGDDTVVPLECVANLHFTYGGRPGTLALYWIDVYGGGLFLPVRDSTAPGETYGGGRYLFDTVKGSTFLVPAVAEARERIVLDFNYAYNPSCAYNPAWVCPLAPAENRLDFPIRAGERRFQSGGRQP